MRQKLEKWWKRIIAVGLVISLLSVGFVIYPKQQKIVLTFGMFAGNKWDVPDDNCYQMIDQVIKEFEKEYPNVTIKYESGVMKDDYSEWLSQKALKGDLPDVFMVLPEDFSTFSSVGMLKNLDSYTKIDKAFKKSNYYEGSYDAGTYKGTQYALPYESVPTLMLVNKTLLKKEHIKMPGNHWTWDDFYEICQKVTKDTDGDGRLDQFGVYNYKWNDATLSNGGTLFNQSGTKCNLSSKPIENAILFTKKIEKISSFRNLTSDDFDSGNIAFRPMTFSEFRTYKPYPWKINKYFDFKWDCIRLPSGPDGENKTQVDNLLMGISNQTKQGDMAWQFLKKLCYETKTQQKTLAYLDSAFQAKTKEFNAIKDKFTLEKDAEYQQVGNYLWPTQTIEKNMHRSYLRFQVNEQGIMSMTSIYCGAGNIHHNKVKVIAPDGSFAETPSSKDSYETTDMNEKIEKADYKLGEDGNVIEFLHLNKDKNIRVEYMGDRTYKTTMSPTDRLAAANVYELAQILSAMEQIKKEQEEANLKIGFINKKKERKAQEEITD